jgi:hydroxypyruvate isomerase
MPRLAANLTMLYNEVDFLDRFAAAAASGFKGVEYLFPYAYPKEQLAEKLAQHRLVQVLHNLPAGDWASGSRGMACQPERVGEFQDSVGKAIDYAKALGCPQVNCLAGIAPKDVDPARVRATFVDNLKFAAPKLAAAGIKLLIEPINYYDIPGFYLNRTHQALDILRDVGSANLYIQYDIYHMQRMEGELAATIKANLPEDRAPAARRQSRPQRARDRRDQLPLPVRLPRCHRLRRLDRLRVQAQGQHGGRPRLARCAQRLNKEK